MRWKNDICLLYLGMEFNGINNKHVVDNSWQETKEFLNIQCQE